MKTPGHRIDLLRRARSVSVRCTCGWKFTAANPQNSRHAVLTPEVHRAMREHLNLRGEARK